MDGTVATQLPPPEGQYAIGDPGRAARELPAGRLDMQVSTAALPGMTVLAASVRGIMHRYEGTIGQDAFALAQYVSADGGAAAAVAVVCDGVGSLRRSDEAARLATCRLAELGGDGISWPEAFAVVNGEVHVLAKEAQAQGSPDVPDGAAANGMATTAVAAMVHRHAGAWAVSAAWIGDSSLWHLSDDGQWAILAGETGEEDDDAFHSSAVRPMPSADGRCLTRDLRVTGGALFLMSDGVANPLRWSSEVQETLARWWCRPPDPGTFAAQVDFARRTHTDDRTVIGIWPDLAGDIIPADVPGSALLGGGKEAGDAPRDGG